MDFQITFLISSFRTRLYKHLYIANYQLQIFFFSIEKWTSLLTCVNKVYWQSYATILCYTTYNINDLWPGRNF